MRTAPSARALNVCVYAGTSSTVISFSLQYATKLALFLNSPAPSARMLEMFKPVIVRNSWRRSSGSMRLVLGCAHVKSMLSITMIR